MFEGERSVLDAVSEVAADGIQTWVGGLGTESGEALLVEGEPVFGARGEPVTVRRNTGLLRAIADAGGGRYADASQDDGLESLAADLRALSGDDLEGAPEPLDATFLLTLLAIPLLLWEGVVDAGRASTAARDAEERP